MSSFTNFLRGASCFSYLHTLHTVMNKILHVLHPLFHALPPVLALSMISRCFSFCLLQHKHLILCLLKESLTEVIARSTKLTPGAARKLGPPPAKLVLKADVFQGVRRWRPQPCFWVIAVVGVGRCSWWLLYTSAGSMDIHSSFQILLKAPEAWSLLCV